MRDRHRVVRRRVALVATALAMTTVTAGCGKDADLRQAGGAPSPTSVAGAGSVPGGTAAGTPSVPTTPCDPACPRPSDASTPPSTAPVPSSVPSGVTCGATTTASATPTTPAFPTCLPAPGGGPAPSTTVSVPASTPSSTVPQPNGVRGVLTGHLVAGPTCPVERPDQPCPPRTITGSLVISATSPRSTVGVTVDTNPDGWFATALPPGTFTIQAKTTQAMSCPPVTVTITAGQTTDVTVTCDTGIR